MKIIILAGGFGTRLSEYTDTIPKPMVPIGGKPILEHIILNAKTYGFKNFVTMFPSSTAINSVCTTLKAGDSVSSVATLSFGIAYAAVVKEADGPDDAMVPLWEPVVRTQPRNTLRTR
mgnify:CR=1 FL=1